MTPTQRSVFVAPIEGVEWRASGAEKQMTVAGHAAVFNRLSHDLGGFREKITPGAFTRVLDQEPDVHLLWDHSTSLTLARTRNKTLDLREDPQGLHFWGRVADTSYARDLRVLMERGDIDQASFAFTIPEDGDSWEADPDENIVRTVRTVDGLYDVTITAQGAYPQSDSSLRTLREAVESCRVEGLTLERAYEIAGDLVLTGTTQVVMPEGIPIVGSVGTEIFVPTTTSTTNLPSVTWTVSSQRSAVEEAGDAAPETVDEAEETTPPLETQDGDEERSAAPETVDASEAASVFAIYAANSKERAQADRESHLRLLKEHGLK